MVTPKRSHQGFTLTELLVSMVVLLIIVFVGAQMMSSTMAVTRPSNKRISTDTQARTVFDRMALDFAQMLKRTDVDYYLKGPLNYQGHGNGHAWGKRLQTGQQGSDQIAFFTQVPGYYSFSSGVQSPFSLVAYRVNQTTVSPNPAWMRLERLSKGLRANGYYPGNNPGVSAVFPIVFLPQTISGVGKPWAAAINNGSCGGNSSNSCDANYEVIGPGVFRMEYYYILKNGQATDVPWDKLSRPNQTSLTTPVQIGLTDIESIAVVIAVMDPEARALMDATSGQTGSATLLDLASDLTDFASAHGRGIGNQTRYIGQVESDWETSIETWASTGLTSVPNNVPKAVASGIRIYSRSFDLKTLSTF